MSSPSVAAIPAAPPERVGCLVIHQTPDELTIRSTRTFGRLLRCLLNLSWSELAIYVAFAMMLLWFYAIAQIDAIKFTLVMLLFAANVVGALAIALIIFAGTIELTVRAGVFTFITRGWFGTSAEHVTFGHRVSISHVRRHDDEHLFHRSRVVAIVSDEEEIELFQGSPAENELISTRLNSVLRLDPLVPLDLPPGASLVCRRYPDYFHARTQRRFQPGILAVGLLLSLTLTLATAFGPMSPLMGGRWEPVLFFSVVAVACIHKLARYVSGNSKLTLADEGLLSIRTGFRRHAEFIHLNEISHFSENGTKLFLHRTPTSNPTSPPFPLLTSLRPQDARFLLDQLTTTITTLKKTP